MGSSFICFFFESIIFIKIEQLSVAKEDRAISFDKLCARITSIMQTHFAIGDDIVSILKKNIKNVNVFRIQQLFVLKNNSVSGKLLKVCIM